MMYGVVMAIRHLSAGKLSQNEGNSLARSLIQSLVECVTQYYGMRLATLRESRKAAAISGNVAEVKRLTAEIVACRTARNGVIADIYKGVTTMILGKDCRKAFKEQKPDCPPNPGGGGGGSSALDSFDPNDIYGYTTESGSKFMTAEVQNMNYRIEFENDPEFATASAHVVEVKDTLNARYFDLKSYKPTSIKIGDKVITLDGEQRFIKLLICVLPSTPLHKWKENTTVTRVSLLGHSPLSTQ